MQQPHSVPEFQRALKETEKEIRELRALESQMRWNLAREEVKDKVQEKAAAEEEIRDWRRKQFEQMKEYELEKAQQAKVEELVDSKGFQEFKREAKLVGKEEELRAIQEEYQKNIENAQFRAEAAKEVYEKDKEVVTVHAEDIQHLREFKKEQKQQEKVKEEETRVMEQSLEMASVARELAKEKEKLLQSLEYVRSCQKTVPLGRRSPG